jgi:response regulator RpfG family c-di-GMP phosphodiesterase
MREAMRVAIAVRRERYDELTATCHGVCLAAARRLKLPQEDLENLAFALHSYDIGLAKLSGQLLRKSTPLAPEESELVRQHPHHGLEILAPLGPTPKVRQIIVHHHERYDGTGYPDGLEGEAIPVGARLLGLADSLNSMLQGRPYRRPLSLAEALALIEQGIGTQFCPRLAAPFLAEARRHEARIAALQEGRPHAADPATAPTAAPVAVPALLAAGEAPVAPAAPAEARSEPSRDADGAALPELAASVAPGSSETAASR